MSLLYSILKPIVRKAVKGSSLHREESYEEFKQASYDIQKKFKFRLPAIKGMNSGTSRWTVSTLSSVRRRAVIRIGQSSISRAAGRGAGRSPLKAPSSAISKRPERSSGSRSTRCCRTMT